ncbi:MAG: hypothetical protein ACP5I1_02640 [Candidatus Hinthialibacter sp.]
MELNPKEKDQLRKILRQEVAEQKAHELGVNPSDLMQRIIDGKASWAKKTDIYIQLDKQRKMIAPKKVMRTLRDGRNSIVSRIRKEIEECRGILQKTGAPNHSTSAKLAEIKTLIEKIGNQSQNLENQVCEIESKIENIKEREPVFKQAEAILTQIRHARDQENQTAIQRLFSENKELLGHYEILQKNLHPHVEKARRRRQELQRVYWQIMKCRFQLQAISIQQIKTHIAGQAAQLNNQEEKKNWMVKITDALKDEKILRQGYQSLSQQTPPTHVSTQDASKIWDQLLPELENIIERQAGMRKKLSALSLPERPGAVSPTSKDHARMAYSGLKKRR